jgi:hypothetical protein
VCTATVKDGGPCSISDQCTSGKCGTDLTFATGDACTADNDCAPTQNLYCSGTTCAQAPFANGKACTANTQCDSQACLGMKCVALGGPGAACGASTDPACAADDFCDVPSGKDVGKCSAKKDQGEVCSRDIECVSGCRATYGELRCFGVAPGSAVCGGT